MHIANMHKRLKANGCRQVHECVHTVDGEGLCVMRIWRDASGENFVTQEWPSLDEVAGFLRVPVEELGVSTKGLMG